MWADIPGWPYQVSSGGRVRNKLTKHVLSPMLQGVKHNQYEVVLLCDAPRQQRAPVHRLVARAFLGEPPKGKQLVLHKNGTRQDNRAKNLYYGDHFDNARDARKHHQHKHKLNLRQVEQLRKRRAAGEKGRALAAEFGVSEQYVCDIHKGRK